jgi:hypothetical protein
MPTRKCRENMAFSGVSSAELTESRSYQPQKLQIHTKRGLLVFRCLWMEEKGSEFSARRAGE